LFNIIGGEKYCFVLGFSSFWENYLDCIL